MTAPPVPHYASHSASTLDFEMRTRPKTYRIATFKAQPNLDTMIWLLKDVEHHVQVGGGSCSTTDMKHLSVWPGPTWITRYSELCVR